MPPSLHECQMGSFARWGAVNKLIGHIGHTRNVPTTAKETSTTATEAQLFLVTITQRVAKRPLPMSHDLREPAVQQQLGCCTPSAVAFKHGGCGL